MNNHTKFAVQPLWSNRAFDVTGQGCVRSAPTNPHAMPAVGIMPPSVDICMTTGVCPPGVAAGQPMPVNMRISAVTCRRSQRFYLVLWAGASLARSITHRPLTLRAIPTVWAH